MLFKCDSLLEEMCDGENQRRTTTNSSFYHKQLKKYLKTGCVYTYTELKQNMHHGLCNFSHTAVGW